MTSAAARMAVEPATERLARLGVMPASMGVFQEALARPVAFSARQELQREGRPITECRLVICGWGARIRFLPDGRRQLISFLLPGDVIGFCEYEAPLATCTIVALTQMEVCTVPVASSADDVLNALRASRAIDEAHLLAQITRIGRLSAQERLCDLFLELHERLASCGIADASSFPMPLTQEMVADALGLTPVHLNRMVQQARKTGDLEWKGGRISFRDAGELGNKIVRTQIRAVAEDQSASAFSFAS